MGLVVYIIAFVTSALGLLLAEIINDNIDVDELAGLNPTEITLLIQGLMWFVVCLIVYVGSAQIDNEKWFKLVTPSFFLTWAFVSAGTILGWILFLLYQDTSVTINGDDIRYAFFQNLGLALGPTGAASLGLRD
ncbi:MAG: hypothetical protein ACXAB7_01060 [Candidatus Kariarchaeaceae archaeon]|jgi:hypothetical protein